MNGGIRLFSGLKNPRTRRKTWSRGDAQGARRATLEEQPPKGEPSRVLAQKGKRACGGTRSHH